jgi:hypothetical protein
LSRLYFGRFAVVHIGGPSSNQAASLESQPIHQIQLLFGRTLRKVASHPYDVSGESIPYYGLRGVLQKGGLLFAATKSEPDLRKYVGAEIRVARGIWKSITEDLHWCNYAGLFPSPDKDQFYKALLEEQRNPSSAFHEITRSVPAYV